MTGLPSSSIRWICPEPRGLGDKCDWIQGDAQRCGKDLCEAQPLSVGLDKMVHRLTPP